MNFSDWKARVQAIFRVPTHEPANPQQYVGKEVEIRYPCGQLGVSRQLDNVDLTHAQRQLRNARSDQSFER